jgi:hypothetical protein
MRALERSSLLCGALVATTLAVALLPMAARAAIAPGRGIAGVRIGDSEAQVRRALGRPQKVEPPNWAYGRPLDGLVGFGHGAHVNYLSTTSPSQKTRRHVGPGSSFQRFKVAYPKAPCHKHARGRRALCVLSGHNHRRLMKTDFLFNGRLQRVDMYSTRMPRTSGPK